MVINIYRGEEFAKWTESHGPILAQQRINTYNEQV